MPLACGIPPIPGDCSITRLLSVMANWPSRKKPSRGVVAIQFGITASCIQECRLRRPGGRLGETDELVLDFEGAQRFEFFQREDVGHEMLLV